MSEKSHLNQLESLEILIQQESSLPNMFRMTLENVRNGALSRKEVDPVGD